ncbi:uncharacterized protein LOC136748923 [Amia ocellicauda]|uniref:uncharacterized protein LOC136748923 n=1 Tax=Amia ocellicauda TaxID=2972642 RepID=UPI003464D6B4
MIRHILQHSPSGSRLYECCTWVLSSCALRSSLRDRDSTSTPGSSTETVSLSSTDLEVTERTELVHSFPGENTSPNAMTRASTSEAENAKQMVREALERKPGGEEAQYEENILVNHMTEIHGRIPTRTQRERYALGIVILFPGLRDHPYSTKVYVYQDFLLLFNAEASSKLLEKWDTVFKAKIIKEAKSLTSSAELQCLLKSVEQQENDDENSKQY